MKWDAWCSAKEKKVPCSLIRSPFLSCKECLLGVMPAGQRVSAMSRSSAGIVAPVSACVDLKHGEGFAICFRNTVSKHLVLVIIKLLWDTTSLTWILILAWIAHPEISKACSCVVGIELHFLYQIFASHGKIWMDLQRWWLRIDCVTLHQTWFYVPFS